MAETVRENEISVMKIALAEQQKREMEEMYKKVEGTPLKKFFWIIGSIIFIAGALYGGYFLLEKRNEKNSPEIIQREESIISYDESSNLEISFEENFGEKIKIILNEKNSINKNDFIRNLNIEKNIGENTKEKSSIKDIFSSLKLNPPASFMRSLSDKYMLGMFLKSKIENPGYFIILETKDYNLTYAGMLEWEKNISSDLNYLFDLNINNNYDAIFKDKLFENRDVRVLYNQNGDPILFYSFINKKNLIITNKESAIKELNLRLIIKNNRPI